VSRESDIKIVCEALIEKFEQYENNSYDHCRYCGSDETKQNGDYVHEVDCPVLVAKDLLT